MLVKIGNDYFHIEDVFHAVIDGGIARVVLRRGVSPPQTLKFEDGEAEYLRSVLDAHHVLSIQHLHKVRPESDKE